MIGEIGWAGQKQSNYLGEQMFLFSRRKKKSTVQGRPARDNRWSKVDRDWLITGLSLARANEVIHGPAAQFHQDGQLSRLAIYCDGKRSRIHNRLELEHGIPEAAVIGDGVLCTFSYGWEEVHLCFENEVEVMHEPAVWDDWVRKWIDQICAGERVHILDP